MRQFAAAAGVDRVIASALNGKGFLAVPEAKLEYWPCSYLIFWSYMGESRQRNNDVI